MRRTFASFLLGACALCTAGTAVRLLTPFYGASPLLLSASLTVGFAALALGLACSALTDGRAPAAGGVAVAIAAAWTILLPLMRSPLLLALEPLGLRAATSIALGLFIGVPLTALAFALGCCLRGPATAEPGRDAAVLPLAGMAFGAACAAPLLVWVLVPTLGLSRTLFVTGAVEGVTAWLIGSPSGRKWLAGTALVLAVFAARSASRSPAVEHDPSRGLVVVREGPVSQYRVVDRTDGRFMLADGGIQTMVSPEARETLVRPLAALGVLDLFFAHPESLLVLGLHGGGIAQRLARGGWRVRVVEPDPLAVSVAEENMSFHPSEVRLTIDDVRRYCRRTESRYPVVILDAFEAGVVPAHLVTREALAQICERLTPDGILAVLIVTNGWKDPVLSSLAASLRAGFRTVIAMPTSEPPDAVGSILLLASNRDLSLPDERLPQPTEYFMNLDEHWLVVQLNHAWFNRFAPPTTGARAFTDDRSPVEVWSDRVLLASRAELHRSFAGTPRIW